MDVPSCFGKLISYHRSDGVRRLEQRRADLWAIADHHSDGHCLAQCAAQSEHYRATNSRRAVDQHDPSRFPFGGSQRERGLSLRAGHGSQHITNDRRDDRRHHDGENYSAGEQTDSGDRALERRRPPKPPSQRRFNVNSQKWREHEDSPHSINYRGNRGEQLNQKCNWSRKIMRRLLDQKDRDTQ